MSPSRSQRQVALEHDGFLLRAAAHGQTARDAASAMRDRRALDAASADRLAAEKELLRGRPDRREAAKKAEADAARALEDSERKRDAALAAQEEELAERGTFVQQNRADLLAVAREAEAAACEQAGKAIAALQTYQQMVDTAVEAFDRLRPRRRDLGGALMGSPARAPVDVAGVLAALAPAVERLALPSDLSADGSPITAESRAAERIRQPVDDAPALASSSEALFEALGQ